MSYNGRKAEVALDFIVVGGGIGGLSTAHCLNQAGHNVTVVDPSDLPAEIGAGVTLSPNVIRLLSRWGLKSQIEEKFCPLKGGYNCSNETDASVNSWEYAIVDGAGFYGCYRPFLVTLLYDLVKNDITIVKGKVVSIDPETPTVTLASGETLKGDVIIGADGIHSVVRPLIIPAPDTPVSSGDVCYRALIPLEEIKKHPELDSLPIGAMQFWFGKGKMIGAYGIGHGFYNLVFILNDPHPEAGPLKKPVENMQELRNHVDGWTPRAAKLVSLIESASVWKLFMRSPIETWVHPSGRVALLGDSAHAMVPYYGQGAAMAVEDAAVLGNVFSRLSSKDDIPSFLNAYQTLRVSRSNKTHAKSLGNANPNVVAAAWKKREGPDAPLPDFIKKAIEEKEKPTEINWKLSYEKQFVINQYGYDADKEVDKWWKENREN